MSVQLYPPLDLKVITPKLELRGATDDLLAQLLPIVRAGVAERPPDPFDDPMSLYEDNPVRERRWLQAIWRGRGNVRPDSWRLYFVIMLGEKAVGMQVTAHFITTPGLASLRPHAPFHALSLCACSPELEAALPVGSVKRAVIDSLTTS